MTELGLVAEAPPLVLAVHGSAAAGAEAVIGRLRGQLGAWLGELPAVGYLDVRRPGPAEVLDSLGGPAVVVPVLLGDGYHRRVDLPALVGDRAVLTPGLSGAGAVAVALYGRLREAEETAGGASEAVVVAAAGSAREGGNDGARQAAAQLRGLLRDTPVRLGYCSCSGPGRPSVAEAMAELRAEGYGRVSIATHLLAPGRFTESLADSGAWAVGAPLADHPLIARLVLRRYLLGARGTARPTMQRLLSYPDAQLHHPLTVQLATEAR
ncbi:hypothetical protein CFP65_2538 [Kitasatospora sp. MMS16-BH015]|uniref:sirohydrochlorin chelatase n=1 Tax=Kitasatospora sp. MMS16-BH015 TaxID=2018025 RepID=UPI000CA27E36|nr:CbiX/SirB N-terminal domain-containing protein [Kitasatospora sp. MMS16-BH015]AUG77367.1 hypothetical protein CFP65_2538 [Kitasatospora sp. MMS16-BH015]